MPNLLTAVIPTRNRPDDLVKAVVSVLVQTRLPDELIIVDQSPGEESHALVKTCLPADCGIRLLYIHDPCISGLVEAKRVATERAEGNIIFFLDDDVILERDFIEQMEQGFTMRPEMLGCSGIVTNPPRRSFGYEFIFHLFHRGIFRDKRLGIYGRYTGRGHALIASQMVSGGLSAWRREVFPLVPFDIANGFHLLEDNDFSTRVAQRFGPHLYINPNARLEHRWSPVNRDTIGLYQRRKLVAHITYYKKRREWPGATMALLWLLIGMLFEATFQALSVRSFKPLGGYFLGLRDGMLKKVVVSAVQTDA